MRASPGVKTRRFSLYWISASRPWARASCGAGSIDRSPATRRCGRAIRRVGVLIDSRRFEGVRERLRSIGDVERILARVALRSARPRDLTQLRASLAALPALKSALCEVDSPLIAELAGRIGEHDDSVDLLGDAIAEEPRRSCAMAMSSRQVTTPSSMSCARSRPIPTISSWSSSSASASAPASRG